MRRERECGRRQRVLQKDWYLGRHLAHEVALADVDTETAENIVSRGDMEIKVRHRQVIEVDLGAEVARLAALGDGDLRILSAVELVGAQALEEVDRLVDARLHLRQAVIDGGKFGHRDTGGASGAEGMLARLPDLPGEGEHVGVKPPVQKCVLIPLLRRRGRFALLDHSLQAAEQLQKYRHGCVIH